MKTPLVETYEQLLVKRLLKYVEQHKYADFLSYIHQTYLKKEGNAKTYYSLLARLGISADSGVNVLYQKLKSLMRKNLDYPQAMLLLNTQQIEAVRRKDWPPYQCVFVMQPTVIPSEQIEKMASIPNSVRVRLMQEAAKISRDLNATNGAGQTEHKPCIEISSYLCKVTDLDSVQAAYFPTKEEKDATDWEEAVW